MNKFISRWLSIFLEPEIIIPCGHLKSTLGFWRGVNRALECGCISPSPNVCTPLSKVKLSLPLNPMHAVAINKWSKLI